MSLYKDSYEGFPIKDAILEKSMYCSHLHIYFYMLAIHMICVLLLQFNCKLLAEWNFIFKVSYHHTHIHKQFEWCKI